MTTWPQLDFRTAKDSGVNVPPALSCFQVGTSIALFCLLLTIVYHCKMACYHAS